MTQPFHLCPDLDELHVNERLNYVLGQVLGVKDFQQEQVYFLHKARLHNRSLHGYGTVWGLEVTTDGTGEELEIQVACGLAIDPQGREVLVDALQCAPLNTWLAAATAPDSETANRDTLTPIAGEGLPLAVYVTLCYRPCQTGAQPILGNPCRTDSGEEGVIQYTRVKDDFELQLWAQPPRQHEEDQVRAIADLLAQIDITEGTPPLSEEDTATLVQTLRDGLDDPARIPSLGTLTLPGEQAQEVLRELFRYWVTNTRPSLDLLHNPVLLLLEKIQIDPVATPDEATLTAQIESFTAALDSYVATNSLELINALEPVTLAPSDATALRRAVLQHWASQPQTCKTTEDDCLLLAAVQFDLTTDGSVDEATLTVENLQRPYLLHTRLLQELLLRGGQRGPQGLPGAPGDPGQAADITIGTVTTGAPGSSASVTNSGTPTNAVLDFTIPQGLPGDAGDAGGGAQVSVGTTTTGAPGSSASVTNSGTPTNAVLNFTIPRGQPGTAGAPGSPGQPGPGLDQLILRPIDLMLFGNRQLPNERPEGIDPNLALAIPGTIRGYPTLVFNQGQGVAAFSTLRPTSLKPGQPPILQLYCTALKGSVEWTVSWRWLRSLNPGEGPRPDAQLTTTNFITQPIPPMNLDNFHLHRSEPLKLDVNAADPDYLTVYLVPKAELSGDGEQTQLFLLMAELRWEV